MSSVEQSGLDVDGRLLSGSATDLGSVVEMFDTMLERSRTRDPDTSVCDEAASFPEPSGAPHDPGGTPMVSGAPVKAGTEASVNDEDTGSGISVNSEVRSEEGSESASSGAGRTLQIVQEVGNTTHEVVDPSSATPEQKRDPRVSRYWKRRLAQHQRPLSVSSTSSSSSSTTSSLPRGLTWRLHSQGSEDELVSRARLIKSSSSGSGDSGLSSPVTCVGSPGSPAALTAIYCDPNISYVDRVVSEIIETEAVYVSDLQEIIEGYLFYWRENPEPVITDEYTEALFGNVQQIFRCNSDFLSALELCCADPCKLAQCFVNHGNRFATYIDYCTKYPRTVSVLTELMRRESTALLFRERQAALGHSLPLGSYLLKPVQRILKYHLLLQNMKSHTDASSSGYPVVCSALEAMTGLARHINDMKRRHEHAVRVQEIQSLLYGWQGQDLTTYGELVAEGAFRMHRARASRHVFLFDRMLLITKRREDATLAYKTHIMCSNLMLIEMVPGEPKCFDVIPFDNPKLQYTLQARTLEQKRDWTLQLKRAILESYSAVIPLHARQLVLQLGQDRTSGGGSRRSQSGRRQHAAPEYLERRRNSKRAGSFNQRLRLGSRERARRDSADSSGAQEQEQLRKISTNSCPDSKPGKLGLLSLRRRSEPAGPHLSSCSEPPSSDLQPPADLNEADEDDDEAPSCLTSARTSVSSDLHCLPHLSEEEPVADMVDVADDVGSVIGPDDVISGENLQSIVQELVLQNMQFRRLRERPRSQRSLQNCEGTLDRSEETDTDCDLDESVCGEVVSPESEVPAAEKVTALSIQNHDNTQYVSFADYGLAASQLTSPRFDSPTPGQTSGTDPNPVLQRAVSDPCRKVVRRIGRIHHAGHSEIRQLIGSIRRKSARLSRIEIDKDFQAMADADSQSVRLLQTVSLDDSQTTSFSCPSPSRAATQKAPYSVSSESLSVHPDYKIYGPAVSQSTLKSMARSFGSRLTPARSSSLFGSEADVRDPCQGGRGRALYQLVRTFRERVISLVLDEPDSDLDLNAARGSVGSRLAYPPAPPTPQTPLEAAPGSPLMSKTSVGPRERRFGAVAAPRPDSMLSSSSVVTSSSDSTSGLGTDGSSVAPPGGAASAESQISSGSETEGSTGSFYEQELDILEDLNSSELFRDSAIYSDPDEALDSLEISLTLEDRLDDPGEGPAVCQSEATRKVPPPVPAKPTKAALLGHDELASCPQLREDSPVAPSFEVVKSISERRRELERWRRGSRGDESETSSQHSTCTVNTVVEARSRGHSRHSSQEESLPRGWVKQVIGKLQGGATV